MARQDRDFSPFERYFSPFERDVSAVWARYERLKCTHHFSWYLSATLTQLERDVSTTWARCECKNCLALFLQVTDFQWLSVLISSDDQRFFSSVLISPNFAIIQVQPYSIQIPIIKFQYFLKRFDLILCSSSAQNLLTSNLSSVVGLF